MSHNINGELFMPIGESGRIVIEIDPELKKQLHQELRASGTNLKDWFLKCANQYMEANSPQQSLLDRRGRPTRKVSQ